MSPDHPSAASTDLADAPEALAALARRERFAQALTDSLSSRSFKRLVLSKPRPGSAAVAEQLQRVTAKPALIKGQACLSLLFNHATRDITKNPPEAEAVTQLLGWLGSSFSHGHLFTADEELQLLYSKRGKVSLHRSRVVVAEDDGEAAGEDGGASPDGLAAAFGQGHQRQKRHALSLDLPFLQALGVTDARKQLVPAMARKWKQINKFVEVLDHALDEARLQPGSEPLHVVDFGAGKGYLTFATHHHLTQQRRWPARVMGVELRPDLVTLCNAAVQRLGLEGLEFACGDVRSVVPPRVDVMIALHACDTATDHALHTGIRQGAAVILSSPCCHKQIRPQMSLPPLLKPMLQHGIHLGQQAEMLTDSLRALLLDAHGYQAQVFEFVALEHTSKNKMILAVKRPADARGETRRRELAWQQVAEIKAFYGVREHCLERLLTEDVQPA